jgi:hypothetical protein
MTRRSPMHQRYQSKKPKGSTGRSAASAKPKRDAGKAAAKSSSSGSESKRWGPAMPQTPESKRLRRIWWGLVIGALAFALASVFVKRNTPYLWWPIMAAYAICLGGAMYLEFFPLRKMRREAEEELRKSGKQAPGGKSGR